MIFNNFSLLIQNKQQYKNLVSHSTINQLKLILRAKYYLNYDLSFQK